VNQRCGPRRLVGPGFTIDPFCSRWNTFWMIRPKSNLLVRGVRSPLKGERKPRDAEKATGFHRRECSFGAFSRSIQLPEDLDLQKANAKYENGLLVIRVPRAESAKPRQITIQTG
jgi:HSP20 family protein